MGALDYKTRRHRRNRLAAELAATYGPRRHFRLGQDIGWHWQFDNPLTYVGTTYMYQDTAGTTPVTAVGQGIGLLLGREYGGVRGVELVTSPVGNNGWTPSGTGGVKIVSGSLGSLYQLTSITAGVTYEVVIVVSAISGTLTPQVGNTTSTTITTTGTHRRFITPTALSVCYIDAPATTTATVTSWSIRAVPGTHLTQATGTAKPTLSARVNGLLGTEGAFSGASWTKVGSPTITLTAGAGPNGESADLISNLSTLGAGTSYFYNAAFSTALPGAPTGSVLVPRIRIKRVSTSGVVTITNPSTAANGQWGIDLALLSNSWETVTATHAAVTVVAPFSVAIAGQAGLLFTASAPGVQFYATQADLRTADDAAKNIPAYQRVGATAADHDTDGFPHGVYPDGTDDSGTTATGGGNTTGFFYCGALTVSGGAGAARTIWSDTGTNTGYRVRINASNKLELAAGNGSAYTTVQSNETITAPGTYLLSAWDDGGVLAVQVNNLAPATTTRPAVSAGTAVITAYKDNGAASSYFNGRDYGSVYAQRYIGETAHNRLKRYLANVARITV